LARGKVRAETQVDNNSCTYPGEGHFIQADGTVNMHADLDLDGNKIVNVEYPTDDGDAANKKYVDDQIAAVVHPTPPTEAIEYFDVASGLDDDYTLANTPLAGTERVYLNGVLMRPGASNDYTVSGDVVTLVRTVKSGDVVAIEYKHS